MVRGAFEYLFGRGANALAPGLCGRGGLQGLFPERGIGGMAMIVACLACTGAAIL